METNDNMDANNDHIESEDNANINTETIVDTEYYVKQPHNKQIIYISLNLK